MFGYLQTALSGQTAAFTLNITSFQSREPGRAVWLEGDRGTVGGAFPERTENHSELTFLIFYIQIFYSFFQ